MIFISYLKLIILPFPSSTYLVFFSLIYAVPTQVENITVYPDQKTITWTAPAEPNGIIVGYTVRYWELGRRDTTEEVNTTARELKYSYIHFSKCSTAYTTHSLYITAQTWLHPWTQPTYSVHVKHIQKTLWYCHCTPHRCRCASQGASSSCHCSRFWGEQSGWGSAVFRGTRYTLCAENSHYSGGTCVPI